MQPIWAPWRMEFIAGEKPKGCIFCLFPAETGEENDRKNLVVARTASSFVMLNKYPYNSGHVMVIPRRHGADFSALSEAELLDLQRLLQRSVEVIREAYSPDGFNIGMNMGHIAGAGIPDHLHYHVVPRWGGDTNFMPVLAETKVLIEHLARTQEKLAAGFARPLA
jgi:ATP adenylyltransferase